MAPIRTFKIDWPMKDGQTIPLELALGHPMPWQWAVVKTSPQEEFEPRLWSCISTRCVNDERPAPSASGNPVIALKNYSENKGILPILEAAGIIRHTGRQEPQGFVTLEMVEVLVPTEELIRQCAGCGAWEQVDGDRFARCSRCKKKSYCSKKCQAEDWKLEHKQICRYLEGAGPDP